jgi:glycosyltransferase involved in cell wall biosynthesis
VRANKGYDVFIEALGRLGAGVQGTMVGDFDDQTRARVMAIARSSGCADRIELRPWARREEITEAFAAASVFVFPSIWPETLGIVGLEALATGVPVVASDVGGVREWLRDGENGYLVPPKDSVAIAERVRLLLDSPERNRAFGEAGLALMREKFAVSVHTDQLEAIYSSALAQ